MRLRKSVQFVHKYLPPRRLPTCKRVRVFLLPSYTFMRNKLIIRYFKSVR